MCRYERSPVMSSSLAVRSQQGTGGDMQNTWKVFSKAMKKIGVSLKEYRVHALRDGEPAECTRLLRLILMGVSLEVAEQMLSSGLGQLSSDSKFVNTAFRYLREQSAYTPAITTTQYHSKGFGEHKLLLIHAAANHVMGYLALGGPRVPSDIHIPEHFSSPTLSQASITPPPSGTERVISRSYSTPSGSTSDQKRRDARHSREEEDERFDESHLHFRFDGSPIHSLPSSSQRPHSHQRQDSPLPIPHSPYEDPDASPTYRRAYRIEHSRNEEDPLTGPEVIKLMQDLEKRIRREYDSSLFVLSNRVKMLEEELSEMKQQQRRGEEIS